MPLQAEEDRAVAQARRLQGTGGEQAFQARLQGGLHGVRQACPSLTITLCKICSCMALDGMAWTFIACKGVFDVSDTLLCKLMLEM